MSTEQMGRKKVQTIRIPLTVSTHLLQIQTILSVLEFHQISASALADCTADREFHPALKTSHDSVVGDSISDGGAAVNRPPAAVQFISREYWLTM